MFSVRQKLDLCVIFSLTSGLSCRPPTTEDGLDPRSVRVRQCRHIGNGTDFSPITSAFPCQYHSTNAPYPCIYLPPTLIKCFSPSTSVFPSQYHSTNAPYSSSNLYYSYKDKRTKPENHQIKQRSLRYHERIEYTSIFLFEVER